MKCQIGRDAVRDSQTIQPQKHQEIEFTVDLRALCCIRGNIVLTHWISEPLFVEHPYISRTVKVRRSKASDEADEVTGLNNLINIWFGQLAAYTVMPLTRSNECILRK